MGGSMLISNWIVLIERSILWDLPVLQAAHAVWWHIQQHGDGVVSSLASG